ncbi:MAG: hypothetical protein OER77_18205, partial [Myxococcales bacterium]|nr:hypothetical protein [Myxococcales bacterium]
MSAAYHFLDMTALVQAALRVRRTARSTWGVAAAFLLGTALLAGFFLPGDRSLGWEHVAWALAWAAVFGIRARVVVQQGAEPRSSFELGALLLVGVHALVQFRGGVASELYPLTYVAVALGASFATGRAGASIVAFAAALDFGISFFAEHITDPAVLAAHGFFVLSFGVLNLVFTRAEITRVRRKSELALQAQQDRVRDETRIFRLVAPASDGLRDEERLYQTGVQEVHQALYHTIELLHRTLGLHTCMLLMPAADGERLHIVELVTSSEDIADGPFSLGSGAVGAAVRRKLTT